MLINRYPDSGSAGAAGNDDADKKIAEEKAIEEEKKAAAAKAEKEVEDSKLSAEEKEKKGILKDLTGTRQKLQEAKVELDAFKAKETKAAEDKLKEEGEFQKIIDAKEKEITEMKPDAEAYKTLRETEIADAKEKLGENWDDDYGKLSLTAIRKIVATTTKDEYDSLSVDDGKGKKIPTTFVMTVDDWTEANRMYSDYFDENGKCLEPDKIKMLYARYKSKRTPKKEDK